MLVESYYRLEILFNLLLQFTQKYYMIGCFLPDDIVEEIENYYSANKGLIKQFGDNLDAVIELFPANVIKDIINKCTNCPVFDMSELVNVMINMFSNVEEMSTAVAGGRIHGEDKYITIYDNELLTWENIEELYWYYRENIIADIYNKKDIFENTISAKVYTLLFKDTE